LIRLLKKLRTQEAATISSAPITEVKDTGTSVESSKPQNFPSTETVSSDIKSVDATSDIKQEKQPMTPKEASKEEVSTLPKKENVNTPELGSVTIKDQSIKDEKSSNRLESVTLGKEEPKVEGIVSDSSQTPSGEISKLTETLNELNKLAGAVRDYVKTISS
jgi:hypothetical protein